MPKITLNNNGYSAQPGIILLTDTFEMRPSYFWKHSLLKIVTKSRAPLHHVSLYPFHQLYIQGEMGQ